MHLTGWTYTLGFSAIPRTDRRKVFHAQFGHIEIVLSQHLVCLRTEDHGFCFLNKQSTASDHRISERPRDNPDMLITLTLYKLARPRSGTGFCLHDQIHFQTQPKYMVCKNVLVQAHFQSVELNMRLKPQTPKPEHADTYTYNLTWL